MKKIKQKRIVIKIGSNSLMHVETGRIDYFKIERLAMELSDIKNRGYDVCLVSSGAIAVGRNMLGLNKPERIAEKQALASVGQGRLMSIYQRYLSQYNQHSGQVLMTKNTFLDNVSRKNAENTFEALFEMNVIPIVNENDTISTFEMQFGDNDRLSAIVCALTKADLLIILSDIDGLYSADPRKDTSAVLVKEVSCIDDSIRAMASGDAGSDVGTGGMRTKLAAAEIVTACGADMIIANSEDVSVIHRIFDGEQIGTLFRSNYNENYDLIAKLEGDR